MNKFIFFKALCSPFKPFKLKFYIGETQIGTPYFLPRKWIDNPNKPGYSQAVLKIVEDMSQVTIPRKLANTLLGILESEYEGTEMFQDEINELKGLL